MDKSVSIESVDLKNKTTSYITSKISLFTNCCGGGLAANSCWTPVIPWTLALWEGSSVHGISQARILYWVAIPFSRASSQPRDLTRVSCLQADSLPLCHLGSPVEVDMRILIYWSIFNIFYISVFFKLFIYFRLCWVFIAVCRLSLVAVHGGFSLLPCPGFSLWCLLLWHHGLWVLGLQ